MATCSLGIVMLAAGPTPGEATGKPVAVDPGYAADPFVLDVFEGLTLVGWRRYGFDASLLDASGVRSAGWSASGDRLSGTEQVFTLHALKLSEDVVMLAWTGKPAGGDTEGFVGWLARTGPGLPTPGDLVRDSITSRPGQQTVIEVVRQDDSHAVVTLFDKSAAIARALVKQVSAPGAPASDWPSEGLVISDSIVVLPLDACPDEGSGCFVLTLHSHTCGQPPPPTVSSPCPADVRLFHILADGTLDPSWESAGLLVTDRPGGDQRARVVSDRRGGAYVVWHRSDPDTSFVMAQHFYGDGRRVPGWPMEGKQHQVPWLYPTSRLEGTATSEAGDLVLLISDWEWPCLFAVSADGSNVPGWTPTGVTLTGGPNDGAWWSANDYRLAVTPSDEVLLVGTRTQPASVWGDDVWGMAFSWSGTGLSGWQTWGSPLSRSEWGEYQPALTLSANGTFKIAWLDHRNVSPLPDTPPYVFFEQFWIVDGTVPASITARVLDYQVEGGTLRASWALSGPGRSSMLALRSADGGEFLPAGELVRSGETEWVLVDVVPDEFDELRYLLAESESGGMRAISDTLVVRAAPTRALLEVRCPSPARGKRLTLEVMSGTSGVLEVAAFDLMGRRAQSAKFGWSPAGPRHVELDISALPAGLYLIRLSDHRGRQVGTRVVRLH